MTARGRRRALLIGIEEYRSDRFANLPSAGVDVRELANALRDREIGYFDDVVEETGRPLAAEDVRREVSNFLGACEPNDFVVLYISGHGARTPRIDGQFHFVATDTDPERLAETGVTAGFVNERLEACRASRKIAIFDCCMSGGFALGFRSRDAKGSETEPRDTRLDTAGVYVLSSSRISESSFAGDTPKDPSQFTGVLIEGLRSGKADADRDGFVGVDELFDYVSDRLRARDRSERQVPVKSTLQVSGQLHLARAAVRGSGWRGRRTGNEHEAAGEPKASQTGVPSWPTLLDYYRQAVIAEQTGADLMDARPGAVGYVCPGGSERLLSGAGGHLEISVPPEAGTMVWEATQAKKDLVYGYPLIVLHRSPSGTPYRHPRCAPLLIRHVKVVEGERLAAYGTVQVNPVLARELLDRDTAAQLAVAYRPTWTAGDYHDMAADIRYLLTQEFGLPEVERLRPELLSTSIDVATPTDGARNAAVLMLAPDNGAVTNLVKDLEYIMSKPEQIRGTALAALLDGTQQVPQPTSTSPVLIGRANDAQRAVIESASTKQITVVTGPPGTGKSELISNLVATAVCARRTVLVASTNNQAVDEVVGRCNSQVPGLLMRTGNQEYKQRQQDALAALLQPAAQRAPMTATTAAAAHAYALNQNEQARRNATAQAELEKRLVSCGMRRKSGEDALAELGVAVPRAFTGSDDAHLAKWRSRTARIANASLFGSYRRRRLLKSLGITVSVEAQEQVCTALSSHVALECEWRELRQVPQRTDQDLLTDLASTANQVRETSLRLTSATVADATAAAQPLIQELLGSLMSQGKSTWSILPKLLPKLRGWAASSLSARNFPTRAGLFDLVIIDEASQCSIAAILPLLFRAKAAVIVGDPMQLRHIATLRPDQDAAISRALDIDPAWLADRRLTYQRYSGFDAWEAQAGESMLLDEHYRCHPHIAAIADALFYTPRGKRLTILTDTRDQLSVARSKKPRAAWDDVPDGKAQQGPGRRSWLNQREASLAAERARWLLQALPATATIGIVTPFKAQADLIGRELRDLGAAADRVRIGTVHTFQGGQCDAIIFSLVATDSMSVGGLRFFDRDENLWNVAITRAKAHLLIIGDRSFWQHHGALGGKLIDRIDAIGDSESTWPHGSELRDLLYARLASLDLKELELTVPVNGAILDARFVGADGGHAGILLDPGAKEDEMPGGHLRRQLVRVDIATPPDNTLAVRRLPAWRLYATDSDVVAAA